MTVCALSFVSANEVVYYSNDFLNIGGSPRAAAMGEAMAADPGDRTSAMYNPASLMGIGKTSLYLSHANVFEGLLNYDFASLTWSISPVRMAGVYLLRSAVDGIPDTRNFPLKDGRPYYSSADLKQVENVDYAVGLSYAMLVGKRFRYGATLKLIRRVLDQVEGDGIALDAGFQYRVSQFLTAGLMGRNITASATRYFANDWEIGLPELYPGISYKQELDYLYGTLEVTYQTKNLLNSSGVSSGQFGGAAEASEASPTSPDFVNLILNGNIGFEYAVRNKVFLRLGTNSTYVYTLGMGIKLTRLNVDVALLHHLELQNSYRFALAWDFN